MAKDAAPEEIADAIQLVAKGEGALSPRAARIVLEEMRSAPEGRHARQVAKMMQTLSGREMEASDLVAEGLSNAQIAQRMHLGEATVKTYLTGAMNKLGVDNRVQLAVAVTGSRR